jgi:hypothetical protein
MKALAGLAVLSLAIPMMGQLAIPPARPQPGIATGASGGIGTAASTGRGPVNTGRLNAGLPPTPPPVYMTPDQLQPPYIDPLWLIPELYSEPYVQSPPPVVARGRPGGLGVTLTGGASSPPPPIAAPPIATPPAPTTPVVTNVPPVATPPPPTNPPSGPTPVPPQ